MGWEALIPLIVAEGIPVAEKLWKLWSSKQDPTQADWDALKAIGAQTARSQLLDALARAGIAIDSPQAQALLALVPA